MFVTETNRESTTARYLAAILRHQLQYGDTANAGFSIVEVPGMLQGVRLALLSCGSQAFMTTLLHGPLVFTHSFVMANRDATNLNVTFGQFF